MDATQELEARRSELTEQLDRVELSREVRAIESVLYSDAELNRLFESGVDSWSRDGERSRASGSTSLWAGGRPDDYERGKCWPLYENEIDLQELRAIGRYLSSWNETAACVLTNLRNYTIGDGFEITADARRKGDEELAAELQAFVDEFLEVNEWTDTGETDAYMTPVTDGDLLTQLIERGPHAPEVRFVGGEHITEPGDARGIEDYYGLEGLDWTFGVATDVNDTTRVHGYYVDWFGRGSDWEFVPASEGVFIKRNTPRQAKRGVNDFAIVYRSLERGAKVNINTEIGAAALASIAYIQEAAQGTTQDALTGRLRQLASNITKHRPDGSAASVRGEKMEGGRIITTTSKYHAAPLGGSNAPVFLDVGQATARRVGATKCMPEYMVSGDASNANYASTLVAESPFVMQTRQEQGAHGRKERELIWKAVAIASRHGRFGGMPMPEIRRRVEIKCEGPNPESRDPERQERVFDMQQKAGVLSQKTRASKSGLDYEEEVANGARQSEPSPMFGNVAGEPTPTGVRESRERVLRFSLLENVE